MNPNVRRAFSKPVLKLFTEATLGSEARAASGAVAELIMLKAKDQGAKVPPKKKQKQAGGVEIFPFTSRFMPGFCSEIDT